MKRIVRNLLEYDFWRIDGISVLLNRKYKYIADVSKLNAKLLEWSTVGS